MDEELILTTAKDAAAKAGYAILNNFEHTNSWEKAKNNLVTDADIAAEKIIVDMIKARFPETSILTEEGSSKTDVKSQKLWIIDPLDGTNNFAADIPHFAVSIAYAEAGNILAGVVFDPIRKEMFHAVKTKGAFLNNRMIHVSKATRIEEAMIATGFYYDRGAMMEATLNAIQALMHQNIRGIRRMGSAVLDLCWTACGRYDAFFEYMLSPWDFAAGKLIIEEAGGKVRDRSGQYLTLLSKGVIASGGVNIQSLLDIVQW